MHKPLTLLQRLAARAEASDCDCQTDDADLINEAIAEIEKLKAALAGVVDLYDEGVSLPRDSSELRKVVSMARAALKGDAA